MLTPFEEEMFRQQLAEKLPMRVVNPGAHGPQNHNKFVRQIDHQLRTLPKLEKTDTSDPDAVTPDGLARNYSIANRARKFMLKGEMLGEFYSRTGLGQAQLLSLSDSEIRRHIEAVARNNANEGFKVPARGGAEAAAVSPRIVIDSYARDFNVGYEEGNPDGF